jgi:argininosuccinate lyase
MAGIRLNAVRAEAAASGLLLATDVAEQLVAGGVPFREAHAVVGAMVRQLVAEGRDFSDLSDDEWRGFSPHFAPHVAAVITASASVAAKHTPQSTSPAAVAAALAELRAWLE